MAEFNDKDGFIRMEKKCRKRFKQHEFLGVSTSQLSKEELEVAFGALIAERNSLARSLHFRRCLEIETRQRVAGAVLGELGMDYLLVTGRV